MCNEDMDNYLRNTHLLIPRLYNLRNSSMMKGFENNAEYYQFDHVTRISTRELANITCVNWFT